MCVIFWVWSRKDFPERKWKWCKKSEHLGVKFGWLSDTVMTFSTPVEVNEINPNLLIMWKFSVNILTFCISVVLFFLLGTIPEEKWAKLIIYKCKFTTFAALFVFVFPLCWALTSLSCGLQTFWKYKMNCVARTFLHVKHIFFDAHKSISATFFGFWWRSQ